MKGTKAKIQVGTCRYCSCTEERACSGGCCWLDFGMTVCSTLSCYEKALADGVRLRIKSSIGPASEQPTKKMTREDYRKDPSAFANRFMRTEEAALKSSTAASSPWGAGATGENFSRIDLQTVNLVESAAGIIGKENPLEEEECFAFMAWADMQGARGKIPFLELLHHVPNGGGRTFKTRVDRAGKTHRYSPQGQRLKRMGLKPGMPDYEFPATSRGFHALHLEFKRRRNGVIEPEQEEKASGLISCGRAVFFCRGWRDAACWMEWYCGTRRLPDSFQAVAPVPFDVRPELFWVEDPWGNRPGNRRK